VAEARAFYTPIIIRAIRPVSRIYADIKDEPCISLRVIMKSARQRLDRLFSNGGFDALFLMNTEAKDANFTYLTGFEGGTFEQSMLVATRHGMTLLTSELEKGIAIAERPKELDVKIVDSRADMTNALGSLLKGRRVGITGSFLPYAYYRFLKKHSRPKSVKDATALFAEARMIKDARETESISKAVSITKKALAAIPDYFKEGMTELQLAARFNYLMGEHGSPAQAFDSIVAFGPNSALPHHSPDATRLRPNSIVLLDVGAKHANYCADMTRTFIFRPDRKSAKYARMNRIIEVVREAQALGLKRIRPGIPGSEVHNAVSDFINKADGGAYKGLFMHALGHGLGLEVHDGPGLGLQKNILKQNMVVSDEPGIYVHGFGGARFEDDVLITKNGARFL
jgi:Xaa-Pro dipeptidase